MLRALFLQELRRSWLAHAGLFAAVFGTAALVEHVATRENPLSPDEENFLGLLLFGGILLSGLISGERCFPATFKEGRYAFFLTLPRPRGGIWLAYLGGRLIGALAALPVLLLASPSLLLRWLAPWGGPFLIAALSIYLVYFLGSTALALALRKEILVYLVGLPLLTGLLFLLAYNASYGVKPLTRTPAVLQESSRYLEAFSWGSLLLALIWTAVSLRAFCRGEIHLGRRTARTLAEAGLASVALVGLAVIAFSSVTLAAVGGKWKPATPNEVWPLYHVDSRPISADGRFLFIRQQLSELPLFTRLAVVDLKSGNTTRWMERPGIYQISWSAAEAVLNVLAVDDNPIDCLGIPCKAATSWYRLSPDLRVLSTRKFPGTGFLHQLGACVLLVTRQGSAGRIYRLSDRDGSFSEILTSELEEDPFVYSLERGAVVVFPRTASLRAWWLDPHGQVDHEESVKDTSHRRYYFVGRRILSDQEVRAEAIQRAFPPSSRKPETWGALLENFDGPPHFDSSQFWPTTFDVDYPTWTVAIVASEGAHRLFLYDDRLGRSIPNTIACGPGEEGMTGLQQVHGLRGLLVYFLCWDQPGRLMDWLREMAPGSGRLRLGDRLLGFVPGSGRIRDLPWHSMVARSELFDRWIYLNPDGISVWLSKTGEVWQATPGRKSLRLNPPEAR